MGKKLTSKQVAVLNAKKEAKKEGSKLIEIFLADAKDGAEVDDMAALLEQALYRDILRRYMEDEDAIKQIGLEQLLKLDISYRKIRIASDKEGRVGLDAKKIERWAARYTGEVFNKIVTLAGEKGKCIAPFKKPLIDWAKQKFGHESFTEIERERKEIEKLNDYFAKEKNGARHKKAADPEPAHGHVG